MSSPNLVPGPKTVPAHVKQNNVRNEKMLALLRALAVFDDEGATIRPQSEARGLSVCAAINWLIKLQEANLVYPCFTAPKTRWYIQR